jgi:hypothetical protein
LNLEIALSGVSAKVKPLNGFSQSKVVATPDDVIKNLVQNPHRRVKPFFGLREYYALVAEFAVKKFPFLVRAPPPPSDKKAQKRVWRKKRRKG